MPYYGLYIPVKSGGAGTTVNGVYTLSSTFLDSAKEINNDNNETDVSSFVFKDKKEALKVLKQHKDARFKEFINEDDATKYAQTGFEIVQNKFNDVKTSTESLEKSAFRAPTKQQLIQFRQIIEKNDWQRINKMILDNPRYLVSSGDTPTILKEGYRYNAMHICAINNCPKVALLILDTVSDPKFVNLLMGNKNDEKSCKELCAKLLDFYINMPEKGRCETPLHFACKYGCPKMVEMLTNYPQCKILANANGELPQDIICARVGYDSDKWKIRSLFEKRYYVPVLRCDDNSIPAQIGEPFSAECPPNLNCDPLTPKMEIKALAGPMGKEQAKSFFRRWKTPPRLGSNVSSPIVNNAYYISPIKSRDSTPIKKVRGVNTSLNSSTAALPKRSLFNSTPHRNSNNGIIDSNGLDKSMLDDSYNDNQNVNHDKEVKINAIAGKTETNNNNHLGKMQKSQINMLKTGLYPSSPLFWAKNKLFSTCDENADSPIMGSIESEQEVNDSLLNVSDFCDNSMFERHVKNSDSEKGFECIGRVLAKQKYIEWREYWDFLDEFLDIASEYGMKKLEQYFAQRQKEQNERNKGTDLIQKNVALDDVCNALENVFRITNNAVAASTNITSTTTAHQSTTPYSYVEKSLQVHARRMTKTIIHNIDNESSIIDALLLELRRVKSLIYSFKEDAIYVNVNFAKVHSRIGNLVSMFLENSQEVPKQMKEKILIILKNLSLEQSERREHMECVCSRILFMLQHPFERIQPENVKTEELCSTIWSLEKDCDCQWESNLSRKTSRRNRMEARYKNHQRLRQEEKLKKIESNKQNLSQNKEEFCKKTSTTNESSDTDEFWSDFGGSDSEEGEVFLTPRESFVDTEDDVEKIFIYGNEPTKRDLDVINAIFHVTIDKTKYPNIHSWKSTIMRYPNEDMDYFPSPRIVKKSHSFIATSVNKKENFSRTPTSIRRSFGRSNSSSYILNSSRQKLTLNTVPTSLSTANDFDSELTKEPILQLPMAKRLFSSPGRPKSMEVDNAGSGASIANTVTNNINVASMILSIPEKLQRPQRPLTPLNKLRGLFSAYRECVDSSPISTSSILPTELYFD